MAEATQHPQDDEEDGTKHITDLLLDESELTSDEELPPATGGVD